MTTESLTTHYRVSAAPYEMEISLKTGIEYDRDIHEVIAKLSMLSDMTLEERRHVAYAIVGEDVPDETLREDLRERYCLAEVHLGRTSMKALDGGYSAMSTAAKAQTR